MEKNQISHFLTTQEYGLEDQMFFESEMIEDFISIPIAATSISLVYNIPDYDNLILTPEVIVDIFSGNVPTWNDIRIKELNPGIDLPDKEFTIITNDCEREGSTAVLMGAFAKWSPEWFAKYGVAVPRFPNDIVEKFGNRFIQEVTDLAVIERIREFDYSIGYVGSYVVESQNRHTSAIRIINKEGMLTTPKRKFIVPSMNNIDWKIKDQFAYIQDKDGEYTYPVTGFIYMMTREKSLNSSLCLEMQQVAKAIAFSMQYSVGDTLIGDYEYSELPDEIKKSSLRSLYSLECGGQNLLKGDYGLEIFDNKKYKFEPLEENFDDPTVPFDQFIPMEDVTEEENFDDPTVPFDQFIPMEDVTEEEYMSETVFTKLPNYNELDTFESFSTVETITDYYDSLGSSIPASEFSSYNFLDEEGNNSGASSINGRNGLMILFNLVTFYSIFQLFVGSRFHQSSNNNNTKMLTLIVSVMVIMVMIKSNSNIFVEASCGGGGEEDHSVEKRSITKRHHDEGSFSEERRHNAILPGLFEMSGKNGIDALVEESFARLSVLDELHFNGALLDYETNRTIVTTFQAHNTADKIEKGLRAMMKSVFG
eukprot:TRINITY_DN2667_c0_g2_i2.p1 TRINITY_DN2667_c0_g2~~TRINITY_DN2667_c0_g2_i2.p1  ORF type:complete len:593 (-),score=189.31 TRINITY_DN2667_c0_g2_i2:1001-2779(-)